MDGEWLEREVVAVRAGVSLTELTWFEEQFREQMRLLSRRDQSGKVVYQSDVLRLLTGLSAMCAQGATPDQIKGWFGLAAACNE